MFFTVPERKEHTLFNTLEAVLSPIVCNNEREILLPFCMQDDEIEATLVCNVSF